MSPTLPSLLHDPLHAYITITTTIRPPSTTRADLNHPLPDQKRVEEEEKFFEPLGDLPPILLLHRLPLIITKEDEVLIEARRVLKSHLLRKGL